MTVIFEWTEYPDKENQPEGQEFVWPVKHADAVPHPGSEVKLLAGAEIIRLKTGLVYWTADTCDLVAIVPCEFLRRVEV